MTRFHPTQNPTLHIPVRKGKKRIQGKETAGCVPLGHQLKITHPQEQTNRQPQEVWSDMLGMSLQLRVEGSLPPYLYFACSLQVKHKTRRLSSGRACENHRPFWFFSWAVRAASALLDGAKVADLPIDGHQFVTEFLEAMKLGHLLLRFTKSGGVRKENPSITALKSQTPAAATRELTNGPPANPVSQPRYNAS